MFSPKNSHSSPPFQRNADVDSRDFPASELQAFEDDERYDDDIVLAKIGDDVGIDIDDDLGDEELLPHTDAVLNFDAIETDIERLLATGGLRRHFEREGEARTS